MTTMKMKKIIYALGLLATQSAFAAAPVSISGPEPAIASSYEADTAHIFTYTVTNNVVGKSFPITVSGISSPVSRTNGIAFLPIDDDCKDALPEGPSTCVIRILIKPTTSNSGQSFNQVLSINYQGRTPLIENIAFSVPGPTPTGPLVIYTTMALTNGNRGGITGADALCQADTQCPFGTTCKAILVDGTVRTASPTLNWVLQPSTQYANTSGQVIGTTNTSSVFSFPLTNALPTSATVWTGLNVDWTTSTSTCNAWTSASTSVFGSSGESTSTSNTFINAALDLCSDVQPLYCAQQP
jgi:hypothetical protein